MTEIMPIEFSTGKAMSSARAASGEATFRSLRSRLDSSSVGRDGNVASSLAADESHLAQLISENAALGDALRKIIDDFEKIEVKVAGDGSGETDEATSSARAASGEATFQSLQDGTEVLQAADSSFGSAEATGKSLPPGSAATSLAGTATSLAGTATSLARAASGEATFQSLHGTSMDPSARAAGGEATFQSLQDGTDILQAVDSSLASAEASLLPGVAASAEISPSAALVRAADAVAETILVTPELARGQGEIRIQLQPDVLGGSTVSVAVTGRQIEITFIPATHEIAVLLAGNQSVLTAQLADRIRSFNVSVDVRRTSAYDAEEVA